MTNSQRDMLEKAIYEIATLSFEIGEMSATSKGSAQDFKVLWDKRTRVIKTISDYLDSAIDITKGDIDGRIWGERKEKVN